MAAELKQQFPDLSTSVCVGILDATGGDKAAAAELLKGMSSSASQAENTRKLRELETTFVGQDITSEELLAILENVSWDVEAAIVSAFDVVHKKVEAEKKRIEETERRRREEGRREEARRVASNWLQQLFATVPQAKITQILDENEGDVDAATEQLLAFVARETSETSEKERKETAARERQLLVEALREKLLSHFITESEIVNTLEQNNYDSEVSLQKLLQLSEQKKLNHLTGMFKSFDQPAIRQALVEAAWDPISAAKTLTNARHKRQKEEEEKKAIAAAPTLKIETLNIAPVVPSPIPVLNPEPLPVVKEEKKAVEADWKTQSVIMNKEIREMVNQQQAKERKQQHEIVKAELELKLRLNPSDVPGPLGMVPITPKIIDDKMRQILAEEEKKEEKTGPSPVASGVLAPPTDTNATTNSDENPVKMSATPERVDTGESIVVEWTSEQPLSTSDWVGILPVGSPSNAKPEYWYWVPNIERKGTLTFTAPNSFGDFEFRFYINRSYNIRGVSKPIHVGPVIKMTAEASAEANGKFPRTATVSFQKVFGRERTTSWIAMYPKSQKDNYSWNSYQWVSYGANQKASFEVAKAGEWEFRFFPEKSKPFVPVSTVTLLIQGNDTLELTHQPEENKITVKCNVETVDPSAENAWVGIYHTTEQNQKQYRRYKYISSRDAVLTFKALQHTGNYEARIYVGQTVVARSNPISITV